MADGGRELESQESSGRLSLKARTCRKKFSSHLSQYQWSNSRTVVGPKPYRGYTACAGFVHAQLLRQRVYHVFEAQLCYRRCMQDQESKSKRSWHW